jgi:NAD(P)-dependent dehydrogenase (short-subunit alcohol dehydrogenase family)
MPGFTAKDVGDQTGKSFVVTGSNAGIGFEAARVLAARGGHVILACRDKAKADKAMQWIASETPKAKLGFLPLDLADLEAVKSAADELLAGPKVDVLINNAGVMIPPRTLTAQGYELQFGVNHLGTFAFTGLVHAHVKQRIVVTASLAHNSGRMDYSDLAAKRFYVRWQWYGMSKLANLLHMKELDRRLAAAGRKTIAMGCHPGVASTELSRHVPFAGLIMPLAGLVMNSAAEGAWPTLQAAVDPKAEGGDYFGPQGIGEMRGPSGEASIARAARDEVKAKELWERSIELTGVDPGI